MSLVARFAVLALAAALAAALASSAASAGKRAPMYGGLGKIDRFDLLDASIEKGVAAFKVIFHREPGTPDDPGDVDCRYPGMRKHPKSGVTLSLFELAKAKERRFVVYARADEKSKCSPEAKNKAQLAKAKEAIEAAGLDITRKPELVEPEDGVFALKVDGEKVSVKVTGAVEETEDVVWKLRVRVTAGAKTLHEVVFPFNTEMAGRLALAPIGAYVEGKKAIFVLNLVYRNMQYAPAANIHITPPIPLAE